MALPLLAAFGIGAGIVAAYNKLTSDDKSVRLTSDDKSVDLQSKSSLSREKEGEIDFIVRLAIAAMHADGEVKKEEVSYIESYIDDLEEKYDAPAFIKELRKSLTENAYSIEVLRSRWLTVRKESDEFINMINEVISIDKALTPCEQAFLFRCKLMLESLPDQKVFKLSDRECKSSIGLEYLNRNNLTYSVENKATDELLVFHPAHVNSESMKKLLIPLSELLTERLLRSQDSELLNVAREAGAKRVEIYVDSLASEKKDSRLEASAQIFKLDASGQIKSKSDTQNLNSKKIIVEFEGYNSVTFGDKLKGMLRDPAEEIIKNSTWLKHDPALIEFVKGCFSKNRNKSFEMDVKNITQRNMISTAKVVSKLKLVPLSLEFEAEFDKYANLYKYEEKKYLVQF